jgi:aryl-alcohol dehydrogenase-like predicted oxidoreductase
MKYRPYYEPALKPMTLGSVQFGLNYGITNEKGVVSEKDSISMIRKALTEGIQYIDTASAYGDSERVIGKSLANGWMNRAKVVTKLPPFTKDALSANQQLALPLMVRNSFLQSCKNLKVDHVDTFMLHRADHLNYAQILDELMKLRNEGAINNIGVSVQSPQELELALKNKEVSVIQMPYNILDYRWDSIIDLVRSEREERSLIIHARSALLQGLLCSEDAEKWLQAGIQNSTEIVNWLKSKFKQYEKMSVADLCIGYVNSQDWIDSVVIGVDSEQNLYSNLQSISMPLMPREALDELAISRPNVESESLNPTNWKMNE